MAILKIKDENGNIIEIPALQGKLFLLRTMQSICEGQKSVL